MEKGQKSGASGLDRHKGTKAAGLYFILLGLPGSGAFKIFHPVLYNKSLDTFKLVMSLNLARSSPARKKGRGGGGRGASQARGGRGASQRSQRMGRSGNSQASGSSTAGWEEDDEQEDEERQELSQAEVNRTWTDLNYVSI